MPEDCWDVLLVERVSAALARCGLASDRTYLPIIPSPFPKWPTAASEESQDQFVEAIARGASRNSERRTPAMQRDRPFDGDR
jgi:hypothetical protein